MSDFTGRFSGKAENYQKYRPKYPAELKSFFFDELGVTPNKMVADIGSGTGISSELFVDNGNTVFAVEPNENMRLAAEHIFIANPNFVSIKGTAENTGLDDHCIDLIFAGTAFHWFDIAKTKSEFARILKPDGTIVISWIGRDMEDALQRETEDIFNKYTDEIEAVENQKQRESVEEFFAPVPVNFKSFPHSQRLSEEEYLGRLQSSSYYPAEDHKDFEPITADFQLLFENSKVAGRWNFGT